MDTASYLRKRLPVEGLKATPYELFYKKQPELSHLRVFGCLFYAHIPKDKRRVPYVKDPKVSAVSRAGVFAGYEA
jgi:hypothetical protein